MHQQHSSTQQGLLVLAMLLAACAVPRAHAQFGRSCADLGNTLMTGACQEFVAYVKSSNEYYYNRPNSELQTFMAQTPAPTPQCCSDAIAFVGQGCSCNPNFNTYIANPRDYSAKTLAVVARAVQLSSCADTGSISNPCDSRPPAAPAKPQLITVP